METRWRRTSESESDLHASCKPRARMAGVSSTRPAHPQVPQHPGYATNMERRRAWLRFTVDSNSTGCNHVGRKKTTVSQRPLKAIYSVTRLGWKAGFLTRSPCKLMSWLGCSVRHFAGISFARQARSGPRCSLAGAMCLGWTLKCKPVICTYSLHAARLQCKSPRRHASTSQSQELRLLAFLWGFHSGPAHDQWIQTYMAWAPAPERNRELEGSWRSLSVRGKGCRLE